MRATYRSQSRAERQVKQISEGHLVTPYPGLFRQDSLVPFHLCSQSGCSLFSRRGVQLEVPPGISALFQGGYATSPLPASYARLGAADTESAANSVDRARRVCFGTTYSGAR